VGLRSRPGFLFWIVPLAAVPTLALAQTDDGATLLALVPPGIAIVAALEARFLRLGALGAAAVATLTPLWVALAAHAWATRPLVGPPDAPMPLMLAAIGIGAPLLAALAIELRRDRHPSHAGQRAATTLGLVAIGAGACVGIAGGTYLPDAREQLAMVRPEARLPPLLVEDAPQRVQLGGLDVVRSCGPEFCEIDVRAGAHGYRVPLADEVDRAPLALAAVGSVVLVARETPGRPRWDRAYVFDASGAEPAALRASDLPLPSPVPPPWHLAGVVGTIVAALAWAEAMRLRSRRRRIARGFDAEIDRDGLVRFPGGAIARPADARAAGPCVVLDAEGHLPTYRDDGVAVARHVVAGTRSSLIAELAARISALDVAAIGAVAIAHAAIVAAWMDGYRSLSGD
jgi:hypothetical protein